MDIEKFYTTLNQTALEGFKRLNKTDSAERKRWEVPAGSWDVSAVRGAVLEKATTSRILLNTKNPLTGEDTRFNVFQIKAYPLSPKIPIMLCNIEYRSVREDRFAGFLDVAPVASCTEDLDFLQTEIKTITEKHGQDYAALRRQLENIYKMDNREKALNAAIGIRLELVSGQADLVKEAAQGWLASYMKISEKREKEPYDKEQEAIMYSVRAGIMEFYMLKDMSFRVAQQLGVPLEALALGNFAPTIRY